MKYLSVRLDEQTLDKLRAAAAQECRSLSGMIRVILRHGIQE